MATKRLSPFRELVRRLSPTFHKEGVTLRKFCENIGLVNFGMVNQHDDEYDGIKGFTASITHRDTHYAVGTYEGYDIKLVNRFDTINIAGKKNREQFWTIIEIALKNKGTPHMFFVPTGREAGEYGRLHDVRPNMQPLNSTVMRNHSPEFHGRFQIYARTTNSHMVETIFTSPVILGIANRFWPHGIEIERSKLLIYVTQHPLTKTVLESALASGLWLAETLDSINEED